MRLRALVAALPLIALAACAPSPSADSGTGTGTSTGAETSSSAPVSNTVQFGPEVPADTTIAEPVAADKMPTVTGSFGSKPTVTMPKADPPPTLQRQILSEGTGTVVKAHDWLRVNYLGQLWTGKVFDNSYDKGTPFLFQVDASPQQVVSGWSVGLTGVKEGSRVLLSLPPQDGYGSAGKAPDISGTDTLVFVVDVVTVYPADKGGQADAEAQPLPGGIPTLAGKLGSAPTVTIPTGLAEPTQTQVVVIGKGTGAPAVAGDVLVQYAVTSWDGSENDSSWPTDDAASTAGSGPAELGLSSSSPFASLIGMPIGSRVMILMPASSSSGQPALAWVLDLVAQADVTPATTDSSGAEPTDTGGAAPTS